MLCPQIVLSVLVTFLLLMKLKCPHLLKPLVLYPLFENSTTRIAVTKVQDVTHQVWDGAFGVSANKFECEVTLEAAEAAAVVT